MGDDLDEKREARNRAACAACPNPASAGVLLCALREVSSKHYAAMWMRHLEFDVWKMLSNPEPEFYGNEVLTTGNKLALRSLARNCDGWWIWSDVMGGEIFVRMLDWDCLFAMHVEGKLEHLLRPKPQ